MERISIFDIYKIGVGPSSSHTLGPWRAANRFAKRISDNRISSLEVHLFGSLSKTGIGHGTDVAIILGMQGFQPETIQTELISAYISDVKTKKSLRLENQIVNFHPKEQLVFHPHSLPYHPNALTFKACLETGEIIEETYYSTGGGFIEKENESADARKTIVLPYPIDRGDDLIRHIEETGMSISEIVFQNELVFNEEVHLNKGISDIFDTMINSVYRGCHKEGFLPGGLKVKRRAKSLNDQLLNGQKPNSKNEWIESIRKTSRDFSSINNWVCCFALAVNEENASLGRIVTAPTNGASGVIPAVLMYYYCFGDYKGMEDIRKFMLTSGEIGCIFKKGATLSAAEGGCQAEIGVSSAMAAGGLTELLGGTPKQVLMAAEIAMEHHLGLTCDPIGGLVQIPCIERNAMGAMKAITASNLALMSDPVDAIVNLDVIIKTMWDTAQDMHHHYKETAEGGLALNLPVVLPNC